MGHPQPPTGWHKWAFPALGILIGLVAIGLSVALPALTELWGALAFLAVLGISYRRRVPWLRDDLSPQEPFGRPVKQEVQTVLLVLGIALASQLVRWLADGGALRSRTGDDDEGYIFLAYQILGYFDTPPIFALRPPGWPLIISGLVSLFGHRAIWSVGLYHRLLLALFPPLLYLVLRRFVRRPVAITAALLSLTMEYNEIIATAALSDLSYAATSLFLLYALLMTLASERPRRWLIAASLIAVAKTLIRLSGLGVVVAGAVALILLTPGRLARRLGRAAVLVAPTLVAVLGLGFYNQARTGQFGLSTVGSFTLLFHHGPFLSRAPDTPAFRELSRLLPEVPPEYLFRSTGDLWITQYRFTKQGHTIFDYGDLTDRAARELVFTLPGEYLTRLGEGVIIMLLDPLRGVLPDSWVYYPPVPYERVLKDDLPACNIQSTFGADVKTQWCSQHEQLRSWLRFEPPWLSGLPALPQRVAHLLTISLPYRLRLLTWPLYWGLAGFGSLILLLTRPTTRRLAILIGLPLLAEFALTILVTNGIETRYLFYFHPVYLIAVWLTLACLTHPSGRTRRGKCVTPGH